MVMLQAYLKYSFYLVTVFNYRFKDIAKYIIGYLLNKFKVKPSLNLYKFTISKTPSTQTQYSITY